MTGEDKPSIYLVGAGRMGSALLRGWLATGVSSRDLFVKEPNPAPDVKQLLKARGIEAAPPEAPGVIVLAVKPQIMDSVLDEIAPLAASGTVILSVAAGRTLASIGAHLPTASAIVRCMPNLPAEIGRGMTAACANPAVNDKQKSWCAALLSAVGEVIWLDDEGLMDTVTAVSGSGPAYVFYLVECLAEAGRRAGLPEETAMQLARATITGAGELLFQSGLTAVQLRENVTSPNGTTAAGLSVLMNDPGLKDLMVKTVAAAAQRSRELAQ